MVGALLQQARKDAEKFLASGGFQVEVLLTAPDGSQLIATGLATGTWMFADVTSEGKTINTPVDHFVVSEQILIDALYPYKRKGEIYMKGHKVQLNDNGAMAGAYVINEQHPNRSLGLIICILGR